MEAKRPVPMVTPDYKPFWQFVEQHELRLQHCSDCGEFRYPVSPVCAKCFSAQFSWEPVSGRGKISTWVVFHRSYYPAFDGKLPYNVAEVQLEEGPRLPANVVGVSDRDLRIDMPVRITYEKLPEGITLYQFTPAE